MLSNEQVLALFAEWHSLCSSKLLKPRELVQNIVKHQSKEVTDIIGVRRCGKSSVLFLLVRELGLAQDQFVYVNFDDPRLINDCSTQLLEQIWDVYKTHMNPRGKPYLFFDEIQLVSGWEKWVRRIRDSEAAHVFVTGSSSALLSREFGTSLTGRHLSFHAYPLSFREFLQFKNVLSPATAQELTTQRHALKRVFNNYAAIGGFPEAVLTENLTLLKDYFEDILYRDVVSRHKIRDTNSLRRLALFLLTNLAQLTTYNALSKTFSLSLDTVKDYLSYLEESFLVAQVLLYAPSLKAQEYAPKKIYAIDVGLRNAVAFAFSVDAGKIYENIVFVELKRRGKEVYYWKDNKGKEVDFLVKRGITVTELIQVCYSLEDKKTEKREIEALLAGMKKFRLKRATVITQDETGEKTINKKTIVFVPLWKWLLIE